VTASAQEPSWAEDAVDAAGGLDLLLAAAQTVAGLAPVVDGFLAGP
jgi:hypothetical protein